MSKDNTVNRRSSLLSLAKQVRTLLALLCLLIGTSSQASELDQQRYHYELAKSSLKKGDLVSFQSYYDQLGDYPLALYLDYSIARKALKPLDNAVVEDFLEKNSDTYLGKNLHKQYLYILAKQNNSEKFLYWYDDELANTALRCSHMLWRADSGDDSVWHDLQALWLKPSSLPQECDPIIKKWRKSDYWQDDYAWQRFLLSMQAGKRGLARYCASLLPASYDTYIKQVQDLDAKPYLIRQHKNYRTRTLDTQRVIAFGIRGYAKRHPSEALAHWERYEAARIFNETIVYDTKTDLIKRLIRKGEFSDVQRLLESSPSVRQVNSIERLIRGYLREQRWADVVSSIELLPNKEQQSDRWRYWQTRAQLELDPNYAVQARQHYLELSKNRSFYGFLASDFLGQNYQLQAQDSKVDEQVLELLKQRPAMRRAHELWLTGREREAHAEWYYETSNMSAAQLLAAAKLASEWGRYDRAIQAMAMGKQWDQLTMRFPLAYESFVTNAAKDTNVDATLIFAVARQESAMSPQAKSPVGARGLMQLMPKTASQTAKKGGIKHQLADLYLPEHNIALGSLYLSQLLEQYEGNRILAAAAYNAGPHRVKRWQAKTEHELAFDTWIETIPFKETRRYVQNVLTYAVIYSHRMGEPEPLIRKNEAKKLL
ncbi:transglycosylase SLT domain-containing protein [Agaribacterium sp. ZY112]|uniref:transglycosylase SLT domain-containing protein n=1 Tax=Agaribacterium sp. ZY112 TaxID=3233574 RepID=UPI0035242519